MRNETAANTAKEDKFTLIDSLITAMFIPKEYGKLLKLGAGKIVRYVIVVLLLVCTIQYAIPTLGSIAGLGGLKNIIMNEIPEFSLKDGKFHFSEKIENIDEVAGVGLIVDTTVEEYTREDVPEKMMQVVMVSENNLLVYNSMYGLGGMVETEDFAQFKNLEISNQSIADVSGMLYVALFFIFLLLHFASAVEYLLVALFYSLFLFLLVKAMMQDLTFGKVYKVALFAQTIGVIVEAVTYCLGIELLYLAGGFFNVMVTVVLMNKVILQYKMYEEK